MTTLPQWTVGYCTNVHAGVDLDTIAENLARHAVPARIAAGWDQLPVGLWLPAQAANQLVDNAEAFGKFLSDQQLQAYTINGFPYDNFHQKVVKHQVYRPTWIEPQRLSYTKKLAEILAVLLPESQPVGSISTLPIGWPDAGEPDLRPQAGKQFRMLAAFLQQLEERSGRRIVVAIEPEPGCILDTTDDVIDFFEKQLPEASHRRYVTVCHDICHSAVMMEPQREVIQRLSKAAIAIGKVQVSSAVVADWQSMALGRRQEAFEQLREFAEDRYLHQTGVRTETGKFVLSEDLPLLLNQRSGGVPRDPAGGDQRWVVHFHVPIFLERFEHLTTSQSDVLECLLALAAMKSSLEFTGHLEIETYAWSVLPSAMRKRELSDDIASELGWLQRRLVEMG